MSLIKDKTLTVVGLGYIGLPTASVFANAGINVLGFDLNENIIKNLNIGEVLIEEPGLPELVKKVVRAGKLKGISKMEESDYFIIAVPTPINEDKTANLDYVKSASKSIGEVIKKGDTVILESTSPPGTTEDIIGPILEESGLKLGEEIFLAHSPERVLPGKIINELTKNDRIIGGVNQESAEKVKELYELFVEGRIFITDSKTAEVCKLMENTYRDVNIALANELAILSENMGVNAWEVIEFANKHPRVNIHQPSPGVGGHCLAVDPWFLIEGQGEGKIIELSRNINDSMPSYVKDRILKLVGSGSKISILGLSYKPNIDDTRESPILKLVELLKEEDVELSLHDPFVKKQSIPYPDLMVEDIYDAVDNADIIVLGVNHTQYEDIDFTRVSEKVARKNIFDTRNFLDEEELKKLGFNITLLGRS